MNGMLTLVSFIACTIEGICLHFAVCLLQRTHFHICCAFFYNNATWFPADMIFIKSCPSGFVMHFTNFSSFLHVRDRHVLHHLSEVGELVVPSMSPYRRREEAAKKAECTGAKTARPKFRSELGHLEKWTHNMVSIKFASSACTIQRNPFSYFVSFSHKEKISSFPIPPQKQW